MKKRNQFTQAAILAVAGVSSLGAMAETLSLDASVTVDNSIDFTSTGALSFGTIRALSDNTSANCAYLILNPNPLALTALATTGAPAASTTNSACPNLGTAKIQSLDGLVERPVFTIAGTPQFTNMTVTVPTGATAVVAPLPTTAATFALRDFTVWKTSGTPAAVLLTSGAGVIQTDVSGGATFTIGATLATDADGYTSDNYQNGVPYEGTFDVVVNYQ